MRTFDVLEVLEPGLQTTVQDAGRFGYEADGVPRSGAADAIGLAVANLLLGSDANAAALECTLLGPRLRALADIEVAVAGAELGLHVKGSGRELRAGASHLVKAGEVLVFRGSPEDGAGGCRAYLAVRGGIAVPVVLDSRSTCLPAAFGGLGGRALQAGDRIASLVPPRDRAPGSGAGSAAGNAPGKGAHLTAHLTAHVPAQLLAELPSPAQRIRVVAGPASGDGDPALAGIVGRPWVVAPESGRRGLRLEPADPEADASALAPLAAGELPSHGVLPGAIQVTPSGQPLVLMADSGTTGGYPVVAVVIHADLPLLGQLTPGAEVRFRETTHEEARSAEIQRRDLLERIRRALGESISS